MHQNVNEANMTSSQGVNPAPAIYAVTVAILAYGLVVSTFDWIGSSPPGSGIALGSALVSVASAAVALAVASGDYRPIVAIIAIAGTVIALDVAVAAGIGILFPSGYSDGIPVRALAIIAVGLVVSTVIAGLAGVGAVTACRRCFANSNPYYIVASAIVVNAIIVSAGASFNGFLPGSGIDVEIAMAAGMTAILFTIFPVLLVSTITFASATAVRRWYSNDRIGRTVSITVIGISVMAAIVAALTAVVYIVGVVADVNAHYADWGIELGVAPAVKAGIIAILGCAVTAVFAGVIAWWYRALRQR